MFISFSSTQVCISFILLHVTGPREQGGGAIFQIFFNDHIAKVVSLNFFFRLALLANLFNDIHSLSFFTLRVRVVSAMLFSMCSFCITFYLLLGIFTYFTLQVTQGVFKFATTCICN